MRPFDQPMIDLNGKSVLITGGTGSFGQALVSEVIKRFKPHKLIIFSRDELKQVEMAQRFRVDDYPFMRYFIGDVRDVDRLEMAMREVDYVVHAAALKHVPIAEYNPFECIQTNVHGAENVVKAAIRTKVQKVIALSTDKAVNPLNLYGASKLAADKIFIAANRLAGDGARFAVVRYGNVISSRGSVVPLFKKMVAEGVQSLPITDPRMTRFWITLRQSTQFVLSSLEMMGGGEIFVPRIPSMKITDLAKAIAPNLEHQVVGIRPGEKLHEVLITRDDAIYTMRLDDRFVVLPSFFPWHDRWSGLADNMVPEDFHYASGSNDEWLDIEGLRTVVEAQE